jgi:uncharacterized flavoprotein (TIGR03862 family)
MAAEVLAAAGVRVDLYDAMPSVGRKFLLAGIGGMNITHSEGFAPFCARYGGRETEMRALLADFDADALRAWVHGLGIETFVGSSGRVFPKDMKAAPLLRAWLHRLRESGVALHRRHRLTELSEQGALCFETPDGPVTHTADAVVLALGGGSWPRLGSDGAWLPWLRARGVDVAPLQPANCGFDVAWSEYFRERFAGAPLKSVRAWCVDGAGRRQERPGECVISATGIEGSLVYALSAWLRERLQAEGEVLLHMDLAPGRNAEALQASLSGPRGKGSLSNHWRKRAGIEGVKAGLLREALGSASGEDAAQVVATLKDLRLRLVATRPLAEAISSAGGVRFEALDDKLMLTRIPGVFCAGEMLDWEAPTGGYLLTGCLASGRRAGQGALRWLLGADGSPVASAVPGGTGI